ncbi:MAG TPA: cyclic nucleotide-binding domain-containing protein [Gammaproteobacteria bacterium]|nr:cyclic nucleotide-binding domain-containing protein [Gammaproteobacteria bacterium]
MINRRSELLVLVSCAVVGIVWAVWTDYISRLELDLDWLIDISSLLAVASFSVREILPLRMLAVGSQVLAIPYFMLQATPLWTPAGWTTLFMVINLYHITRILLDRRPVKFLPDEQRLYDLAFGNYKPREFLKLLKIGEWRTAHQDERIFSEGDFITKIVVPVSGSVSAVQGGKEVSTFGPGELIGAAIVLTNQHSAFEARFTECSRYMCWSKSDIDQFHEKNPGLAGKFNDVANRHLVEQINKLALILTGNALVGSMQPVRT